MKNLKKIILLTVFCSAVLFSGAYAERIAAGNISVQKSDAPMSTISVKSEQMTFPAQPTDKTGEVGKQGGEDIAGAVSIGSLPYDASGTTIGYENDYDEQCPNSSASPDVVYSYNPPNNQIINILTCGSGYWTKLFVYENDETNAVACNQYSDTCWANQSAYAADIYGLEITTGNTYYIVVDGWGGQQGAYDLHIEAWPPIDTLQLHPTLANDNNGNIYYGHELYDYDSLAAWYNSHDEGDTWNGWVGFNVGAGVAKLPSVDYWCPESLFCATYAPPATSDNGGNTWLMNGFADIGEMTASTWNWAQYGFHDMKQADIACGPPSLPDSVWAWGTITMVHSTTYPDAPSTDGNYIFYPGDGTGYAYLTWFDLYNDCISTSCDVDRGTGLMYGIWDRLDETASLYSIVWNQIPSGDTTDVTDFSNAGVYSMTDGTHLNYPCITSYDGNIIIVCENYEDATPSDRDIVCLYVGGTNLENLTSTSVVTGTAGDERYPRAQHIGGTTFLCTYIMNNEIYAVVSGDNGLSWGTPEVISLVNDSVMNDYHTVDIAESDGYAVKIIYEYIPTGAKGAGSVKNRIVTYQAIPYPDTDGDTVPDHLDNCPNTANTSQTDDDGDDIGNVCDNCELVYNPGQENNDADSLGNLCDNCPDTDNDDQVNSEGDLLGDICDNCPTIDNQDQANGDADSHGDVCDNCPAVDNEDQANSDADSHGDVCDNCPDVDNEDQVDLNENGVGDACDWICGDATDNGSVDILDITFLISYKYKDGPAPANLVACDVNSSGTALDPDVNLLDITYLIAYKYKGGPTPNCP